MTPWSWLTEAVYYNSRRRVGDLMLGWYGDAYKNAYLFANWQGWPHSWNAGVHGAEVDGDRWFVRIGNNGTKGLLDLSLTFETRERRRSERVAREARRR